MAKGAGTPTRRRSCISTVSCHPAASQPFSLPLHNPYSPALEAPFLRPISFSLHQSKSPHAARSWTPRVVEIRCRLCICLPRSWMQKASHWRRALEQASRAPPEPSRAGAPHPPNLLPLQEPRLHPPHLCLVSPPPPKPHPVQEAPPHLARFLPTKLQGKGWQRSLPLPSAPSVTEICPFRPFQNWPLQTTTGKSSVPGLHGQ